MKKPSINITIVEKLSKEDKTSLETLHKQAFAFIFNRSSEDQKEHNEKFCSQKDIAAYVLAKEDSKLIGSVIVYQRFILLTSRPVSLGGIGGVAVDENYRHQGIATRMLKKAMQELSRLNADVAYLCTDVNKLGELYKLVGFKSLSKQYTYLSSTGKRYTENGGMIAPVKSPEVIRSILISKQPFDIGVGNW